MTRKQAITEAINALTAVGNTEPIPVLKSLISDLSLAHWTQNTILDAVEQFIIDNGRVPKANEFQPKYKLPNRPIIKIHFGMSVDEFMDKHFSSYRTNPMCRSKQHGNHTCEYWLEDLRKRYIELEYPNADEYNKKRNPGSPSVYSLKKITGLSSWEEILVKAGIERQKIYRRAPLFKLELTSYPWEDNLENLKAVNANLHSILMDIKRTANV